MKSLEYKNDNLFFDGIAIEDIAKNIKTPFYIYSEDSIKKNIKDYISDASQKTLFCYSVKANSNLSLLKLIASQGMGFDVVSKGELHRAIKAGANPKRIVYSGVGKTKEEIAYALNNKILCFNVESEAELFAINSQASLMKLKADISIRINPDVKVKTHPYISTGMRENKFGIPYEDAFEIYKKAKQLDSQRAQDVNNLTNSLSIDITLIDAWSIFNEIVNNADHVGITNTQDQACSGGATVPLVPLPICGSGANVVSNVDEYLFFDKAHPSATMHKIIGQFAVMNIGDEDTDGDGVGNNDDTDNDDDGIPDSEEENTECEEQCLLQRVSCRLLYKGDH